MNKMAKTLELVFITDIGKQARLSIEQPIEPIDLVKVKEAMEEIISSNAFFSANGNLSAVGSARLIERNVTDYEL